MRTLYVLAPLCLSLLLSSCEKPEPVAPPSAEAITAYVQAALNGNTAQVATALTRGMPVNQTDTGGNNALMAASFNGHIETMKALIDAGADVNQTGHEGATPLIAACGPFPEAVRLLLENGAEVNAVDSNEHFSALMYAAVGGLSPIVDILLEAGADPTLKDVDGDTAASFARQTGFTTLADKLQALIDAR